MHKTWSLYALLAALRVAGSVFLLGMVHPDEFFQSQEVMARHVLPIESPLRRQLFLPFLVAGGPYKLLELLGVQPAGFLLLVLPRLLLCGASFLIDAVLYAVVGKLSQVQNQRHTQERQEKALVLFASSWPTLVFLCRPFSNTFETLVLTLCFAALFLVNPYRRILGGLLHVQTLLLGSLLAVGFFTRFTFPVFFFALGLELVRQQDELLVNAANKKEDEGAPSVVRRVVATIGVLLQGLMAFLWWVLIFVAMDTLYYRPELFVKEQNGSLLKRIAENAVVAPLNNLFYNMQYDNLELHGVHPRLTHLTVNMPMLFGPVFLVFLVQFLRYPDRLFFGNACVFFPLTM
ncbi:hypothetical protein BBO99_00004393 [Phytophthora kernoviae]|uniref:Mannosyltransferase n=2 Tax=Phytophthora kernoviae TaxID=325452 RepID=A0A421GRK7_9STRA|nr:hypothetical protein G195_005732 [Phytophthora kernoviae 00238/432]KAG2524266.1 hypothetical protein JM16_005048 [Phytophthora kernoviae]KAG2526093.1 hypothetical protein JM18_004550 [Phytophthora kernoviae]RLN15324.1 hypothetical protein BBI17_004564 [Phytophthora kernoviae]RLN80599.1 hypothetical protein BBO99_00004393 [Phytophthora kernoviae]